MNATKELDLGGVKVGVSNLDKVFYPKTGFTKGDVIDYYTKVSDVLLPHLKNRPITLKRYPNGVEDFFFYEKRCPSSHPKWVKTANVERTEGGEINYCMINDLASLVWAANLADIELHTFLHKAPAIDRPTALAFDLDPGAPADILLCGKVALWLEAMFTALGMRSFAKTSGSKGLQVYVPLNTDVTYEKTKAFAHSVAEIMEQQSPDMVVAKMQKQLRKGKVLLDWSQNDSHKTTVCAYSLRAKERPNVSTPVTWEEIKKAVAKKQGALLQFGPEDVLQRIKKRGDLFAPVLTLKQKLPSVASIRS
jgi:bifunctional non-homologous end joining protein LigD